MRPRGAANIAKTAKNAEARFSLRAHKNRAAINSYFDNDILINLDFTF